MKTFLSRFIWLLVLLLAVAPALAQDDDDAPVELVPFADTTFGVTGVIPDGWREIAPGTYARAASQTDVAMMVQQSAPATADQLLTSLLPQLRLTEAPESVGSYETDFFDWTLYEIEVVVPGMTVMVDLALAENDGVTYLALLQAADDERDALYPAVFIPALDALAPRDEDAMIEPDDETLAEEDLPYLAEEVTFGHDDITLAGTLTLPEGEGPHPAVILITGSGPQDRDESLEPLADIKPFRLIADYLTPLGIAVLRYDDRGVGQSTGDFATATSADFADDTEAALDFLLTRADINPQQIGLLGHSEGGLIAAMLAARRPDVAFVISMAGQSVDGRAVLTRQNERLLQLQDLDEQQMSDYIGLLDALFDAVEDDPEALEAAMFELVVYQLQLQPEEQLANIDDLEAYARELVTQQTPGYESGWFPFYLTYDPTDDWAQITAPVLALLGELDVQVDAEQNAAGFEAIFEASGHDDYTIVVFPTANHLFQDAVTGGVEEYGTLEQDFLPDFLPTIADWLLARVTVAAE